MIHLQLFRLRLQPRPRTDLFNTPSGVRSEVLRSALEERPSTEVRVGHHWHIGNVTVLDDSGVYFAVGRVAKRTLPSFDARTGNFREQETDQAPYAHTFLDVNTGLLAIARNSHLAATQKGIARQIERLLHGTSAINESQYEVSIAPISDPDEFLKHLRAATAVTSFKFTFSRPNPFDVNEDFQRPLERLLEASDAKDGHTVVKGRELNADVLEELTRSVAATGEDASATMRVDNEKGSVRRNLREQSVVINLDEPSSDGERLTILERIRQLYRRVRGKNAE